jgi:hypothetical protein
LVFLPYTADEKTALELMWRNTGVGVDKNYIEQVI